MLWWQILSVWALHIRWPMLKAASFASSESDADLDEQVHTKQACPIFKIGTVNQQQAAPAQSATLKNTEVTLLPSTRMWKTAAAKTFKCPERLPVTAYKSNPTALTPKHGWIRQGWSQSNQQPWHSKMLPNPRCSKSCWRKSPWITAVRQLQPV